MRETRSRESDRGGSKERKGDESSTRGGKQITLLYIYGAHL